jgi:methionyl-tRNA synthetase
MSDISTGKDADFSEDRLVSEYNAALANSLGNLLNRTLNMAAKYREGAARRPDFDNETLRASRTALTDHVLQKGGGYECSMESHQIETALSLARACAQSCNEVVEKSAPWKLAKDPTQTDHLDSVLYHLAESLRIIAILISPVLPKAAHGIFDQLNWKLDEAGKDSRFRLADAVWGGLPDGHQLGKPVPLFPRIETAPAS